MDEAVYIDAVLKLEMETQRISSLIDFLTDTEKSARKPFFLKNVTPPLTLINYKTYLITDLVLSQDHLHPFHELGVVRCHL